MLEVPSWLNFFFIAITLVTYLFIVSSLIFGNDRVRKRMHAIALLMLAWVIFQSTLSLNRWYMDREAMPPHLVFPVATTLVILSLLLFTGRGKRFISGLSLQTLTWLHVIRIPVEIALYWLAFYKQVPWSMTFYGHNFDIIFGITAPIMAFGYFHKGWFSLKVLKIWNTLGVISLLIIVVTAFGAAPSPIQAWDFERPNYAVTHFPFSWLPSFIVPAVLFAHLVALVRKEK
ncbi:MAG: hypothetical protein ACK4WD_06525 [Flavobacteriales bacterium]|jgi:hypothetical protein